MEDFSKFVPNVHFEQIPIKNLVSNQDYQRNLSESHIKKASENFDIFQVNPVKVSKRNGINYVFNGQHTIEIIARVSGSRDTPVWCMVYDDLCYEHEADIFANQMKFVRPLTPYEIFIGNIEAGNDEQLMIRGMVESYGMVLGIEKKPGVICAVATVEQIFKAYGYQVLSRTLRLIIGTWEGDVNSFSANMMKAVAKLVAVYGDSIDDDIFKEKLGAVSIKYLARTAKERCPGAMGFAEAIIIEYNGKRKTTSTRLPINKLYSKRSSQQLIAMGDDELETEIEDDSENNE